MIEVPDELQGGRVVCPNCQRKGLGYAMHPHAYGWKDYGRAKCRYCKVRLVIGRDITLRDESREDS